MLIGRKRGLSAEVWHFIGKTISRQPDFLAGNAFGSMGMKNRTVLIAAAAFTLAGALEIMAQQSAPTPPQELKVSIDTQQTAAPVSQYEYGMFIEHIGQLVYRSLWSEMLDDRKFYFPITAPQPEASSAQQGGPFRGMQVRKWHPVGSDSAITLDEDHPFVGDHSPRIQLDASTPHGVRQEGFALVKGKKYTGHIWLRATRGSKVSVSLVWGSGEADRQTIALAAIPADYKSFPLTFTSQADAEHAALEITGTGSGNFHIGAVSLMPADNVDGFRPDTIALLKQLHSGFWRLPGGNFISNFNWYHSVGPRDQRPPDFDYAWNAMQTNDVGMDEFMTFCKLIGVEPYITVNA